MENTSQNSGGDPEEQDVAKLGGPTAQAMGTEYQMVSEAGTTTAQAAGEVSGEAAGADHMEHAGREPEYYYSKQSAQGTADGGEMVNKPHDTLGEIGRHRQAQPEAREEHGEKGT
ncbi:MAG TPA: hypothetical protein VF826_02905 [Chloroflexia bacterium]|jgi:hypothetical protein